MPNTGKTISAPPPQSSNPNLPFYYETSLQGAGFWIRALARTIDTIIHNILAFIAGVIVGIIAAIYAGIAGVSLDLIIQKTQTTSVLNYTILLLGMISLSALSEGLHGSSMGKLICGLVVIKVNEEPCTIKPAIGRSFALLIDSLFFGAVAATKMSENAKKQRHGDNWAKTMVVKRKHLQPAQLRSGGRFTLVFAGALLLDFSLILTAYLFQVFS